MILTKQTDNSRAKHKEKRAILKDKFTVYLFLTEKIFFIVDKMNSNYIMLVMTNRYGFRLIILLAKFTIIYFLSFDGETTSRTLRKRLNNTSSSIYYLYIFSEKAAFIHVPLPRKGFFIHVN